MGIRRYDPRLKSKALYAQELSKQIQIGTGMEYNDKNQNPEYQYVGFWIRAVASIIDSLLLVMIITPLVMAIYGRSFWLDASAVTGFWYLVLNYVFPIIVIILFWIYKSATPGKMVFGAHIIDEKTGQKPSKGQLIGRYLAYYLSTLILMLGFIWIGIDKRKQGWHDKLAGTLVIYKQSIH